MKAWTLERYALHPVAAMNDPVKLPSFWQQSWKASVVWCRQAPNPGEQHQRRAAQKLGAQFHPLDITAAKSIAALKNFLQQTHGRLDVLVNNAGVIAKGDASGLDVDLATIRTTLETNTLAPLHLSQALAPLLRRGKSPRIVNISSGMGSLSEMEGDHAAYRISKAALNAVTTILAVELRGIVAVNSASPGWVKTDMGGPNADREVAEGAATPVWLALDAPQRLTGKFLHDRKVIPW